MSLYALGVVLGAPTIAGLVARFPRHRVMIGLAIALTLGNGLAVVLPTFETVGLGRPTDVQLAPFYRLAHERYNFYWKVLEA